MKTLCCLKAGKPDGNTKFAIVENEKEADQAWHFFFDFDGKAHQAGTITMLDEVDGHHVYLRPVVEASLFAVILITTMREITDHPAAGWHIGSTELVAWYATWQAAHTLLTHQTRDCSQTLFRYALIEEIKPGLHPAVTQQWLYEVTNPIIVVDELECDNPDCTCVPIEVPSNFISYSLAFHSGK